MPMNGQLGEILLKQTVEMPGVTGADAAPAAGGLEFRLQRLEQRVADLEGQLRQLGKVSFEQQEMIRVMGEFVASLVDLGAARPLLVAASADASAIAALERKVARQEMRLAALTERFETMAGRLAAVEKMSRPEAATAGKAVERLPYTGLVIDARGIGFKPCLKPGIYGRGRLIYPGGYVNKTRAVKRGFIRYYRKITRAQQSERVGALPLTIKAAGTRDGNRNLAIGPGDQQTLERIIGMADNFLANCNVVIVF